MERDWAKVIAALRAKANDPAVSPQEAQALTDKANELEVKYKPTQRFEYVKEMPFGANTVTVTIIRKDGNSFGEWLVDIDETESWQTGHYQFPGEEGGEYG